ncbi:hypothetical protein MVEN_00980900 [Mycena venus]|uniref:F-box domain-containing protein n=1 Tax=Mycena venus TaxID=2733690 RepID=A0A8H6Y8U8_9AGAR|nr:hypothetical protein MVEN_00980900 [Mycena venus]
MTAKSDIQTVHTVSPFHPGYVCDVEERYIYFGSIIESTEQRRAREIRTQHNELLPIGRLPAEILADIFVRCVPTTIHSDLSFLHLTRVCSRWRNIALECPDFWSTLIFSRPEWTPVMLVRSKMASLIIRVDLHKDHANSPEPILLEHTSRLGTLDIRSPQPQLATFMDNLEHAGAAPRLQYIKIVNASTDNLGEGDMWLPRNLFRRTEFVESRKVGMQPGVRLHLECCAFPWDSGWYSHLTHLHLENINPTQRPTMEAFLAILVGSPNLQTLSVIDCSPTTSSGFTVELPHLTALTIKTDSPSACLDLLGYLNIPPSASTDMTVKKGINDRLLPVLPQGPSPNMFDTVRIEHTSSSFAYSVSHSARPEWARTLRTDAAWTHLGAIRAVEIVRKHLDFSNVTILHLRGMNCLPPPLSWTADHSEAIRVTLSLWDTLGRALPHVRTLHIHKSFPALWLDFLLTQAMLLVGVSHYLSCFSIRLMLPRAVDTPAAKYGTPLFRGPDGALTHAWAGLRCLALHDIDLHSPVNEHPPGKAPIWRLEIEGCDNVSAHDLAHFRLFADVEWDGKGQTEERKADEGDESLRSYSVNVFAEMVEFSRSKSK